MRDVALFARTATVEAYRANACPEWVRTMSDSETFRTETRAWLEANLPPSMRGTAVEDDDDNSIWGGRKARFK
jgi:hypothetical protein